ncbi:MAG: cupin domain-containing protein [Arenicellales bacterium]|nr:cupin domain-containing protein [Arenicellales bacterium]
MASIPPKVEIDSVERMTIGNGDKFSASIGRIGTHLGMTKIGCTVVDLEPGKRAWPHHLHYGQEELFIILEGEGTLRYGDGEYQIHEGEIFFAGTGPGTAHQIVNTSGSRLRYLALSSMDDPEICYYPDSKKYGAYCWREDGTGVRFLARDDSSVDYFDGE